MKISSNGLQIIKESEGLSLKAYPDPGSRNGHPWTIGYGHTGGVKPGTKITQSLAERYLKSDVEWAEKVVNTKVKVSLTQNQFDALVSFVFNIGESQFASSTCLRRLNAGEYKGAAEALTWFNKNDGKVMSGLVTRRAKEKALFLSGRPNRTTEPAKRATLASFLSWLIKKFFS